MHRLLKQAFTLIELLVVIAIIGILSGLIIVGMNGMTQKATIAKAQVFSNSLRNSLMMNIIAEYKFEEGSGTNIIDTWGRNTGTWYGSGGGITTPSWITNQKECVYGNCLAFDGTDDYVSLGNPTNFYPSPNMSLSFWVKPLLTKHAMVLGKFNSSQSVINWTYGVWIYSTGALAFGIGNGTALSFSSDIYTMSANIWHHILINYMGSSNLVKYYVNGQYISGKDLTISVVPIITANSYTISGDVAAVAFPGSIDDIRIYNAAMPTSQVKEQYYAGLNQLFANGGITKEDYQNRMGELAVEL